MTDFLGKALGKVGDPEAIGKQAGQAVEGAVKKVISGNKHQEGKKKKEEAGGAGGAGGAGVLGFGDGNKEDGEGGGPRKSVGELFK